MGYKCLDFLASKNRELIYCALLETRNCKFRDICSKISCGVGFCQRGLTIFFTGLSGSGKSTLANGLLIKLLEEGSRPVTLLDGDIVRTHLSSELGFSKEHRNSLMSQTWEMVKGNYNE